MLRIFGFYQFNNCGNSILGEDIVREMTGLPITKSKFTKVEIFNFKNIFLGYEMFNSSVLSRYFFIDKRKKGACFIVGNIFAYEKKRLEVLSNRNIANFVFEKYKKEGLNFCHHLRGEFNAILIDKEKLYLINDKLGLSPMYIYKVKGGVIFCSEAEPIIWLGKNNHVDYDSIAEFLVYGFIPDGKTFIKNLYNQAPGTIISISNKKYIQKKYPSIDTFPSLNNLSRKKRAKFVKNLFIEAVKIRMPMGGLIAQELSGGWDTRFVLANLLLLGKNPIAITLLNTSERDLFIAKHLAKKLKIKHCIINDQRNHLNRAFDYNFRLYKRNFFIGSKNIFLLSEDEKDGNLRDVLLLKKFTGLFGSEIFGFMSHTFFKVFRKDFSKEAKLIFSDRFLSELKFGKQLKFIVNGKSNNVFYLFLTQFVRSYWNVYMNMQRDRVFDFFSLHPFTDSKIVAAMSLLDYKENMNYKLYTEMYKLYDPAFLKIPYTFEDYRKVNVFKDTWEIEYEIEQREFTNAIFNNQNFLPFLKDNQIIKSKGNFDYDYLRKLYCLFKWFDIYKPVLNHK